MPFTATYTKSDSEGTVYGWFYRWSDGSTRFDTGPALTDIRSIDIKNIASQRWYGYLQGYGWSEHPMQLGNGEFLPTARRATDIVGKPQSRIEGLTAVESRFPDGRVDKIVPELNYFSVDRVYPNGTVERFRSFRIGAEPDVALLTPPPGTVTTFNSTPKGIVVHTPEDTEVDPVTGTVKYKTPK